MAASGRVPEIDGLRGIAAVSVVVFHYLDQFWNIAKPDAVDPGWSVPWTDEGVSLFFVLSGLVILRSLDRGPTVMTFARRRARRLYPVYWVSVLLTSAVLATGAIPGQQPSLANTVANLTMVQEHLGIDSVDGVYWSLGVELSFYFFAALGLAAGLLRERLALVLWIWVAAAAALELTGLAEQAPFVVAQLLIVRHVHLFAAGMAIHRGSQEGWSWPTAGVVALAPIAELIHADLERAAWTAATVALVVVAIEKRPSVLRVRPLLWLGAISYPLYLTHQFIGYAAMRELIGMDIGVGPALGIVSVGALALAHALHLAVEQPAASLGQSREPAAG